MVNCSDSNAPFIDSFRHPRHRKIFASKIEGSRSIVFYSSHLVNNIRRASNRSKKSFVSAIVINFDLLVILSMSGL
jgi:hypothetical protein